MEVDLDPSGGARRKQLPWNNGRNRAAASWAVAGGGGSY